MVPNPQEGDKIGGRILEGDMDLIGPLFLFHGAFTGILNAQGRGDNHHFLHTMLILSFKDHPGNPGINGQAGHTPALLSQLK